MFEASLMESQGTLATQGQRSTRRALLLVSITFQCSLAALFLAIPLLHPERLPFRIDTPRIVPMLRRTPPPIPKVEVAHTAASSAPSLPSSGRTMTAPPVIPTTISLGAVPNEAPIATFTGTGMTGNSLPGGLAVGTDHGITVVATKPAPTKPVRVSAGVSAGLLVQPIRPVYPGIAKAAHMEGAVVIEAIISKSGQIESAHVISGPAMLQRAALEAVRAARYSPYRLNGEATEVETTITINFRLGS
jgi:protein TonB